jgi:hypothetical protein
MIIDSVLFNENRLMAYREGRGEARYGMFGK